MHICIIEHPRISSRTHFNDIANTPLWSCLMGRSAAAALTAAGHDVTFLDAAGQGLDFDDTRNRVTDLAPDLLAVNAVYFWEHSPRLLELITTLKDQRPSMHINLFGFFPSLAFAQLLTLCPAVDSVCVGECEQTLVQLAGALAHKRNFRAVPGIAFERDGSIAFPSPRPPALDPDRFRFPFHPEDAEDDNDTASILGSRGCYNCCAFCPIPVFYNRGPLWRGRSPENILKEVKWLIEEKGFRRFYFVDPNFVGPGKAGRRRTLELMADLAPLEIRFGMETRPDDLDADMLAAMTRAGLESLLLGIESGSPEVLGNLSKHTSINSSSRAIHLCRRAGIEPEVGFLMHTPDATVADLIHNLNFLEENDLLDRLDRTANLLCHRQIVFRGTRGFRGYETAGRILGSDALGFQVEIAWKDAGAKWVADVMVPVCLDVLRLTGDRTSLLYWMTTAANKAVCGQVNDRLVEAFRKILRQAEKNANLTDVKTAQQWAREYVLTGI